MKKKCKGYIGFLNALDNSTQEILDKIIEPYQKNNEDESDDNWQSKNGLY